ncbi:MAG: diguanylate cyclase [Chloroflexi bacterium]|nr:diguanylate cyclase [Chloroflexota bacterium]
MIDQTGEGKDPVRLLTIGYMLALTIIAVMSICIHVVIGQVVAEQNNAAIVISARQGKLSQIIALHATQYAENKDSVSREQLRDAVDLMATSHQALTHGDRSMDIPAEMSADLRRIYFALPYNLDEKVTDFIDHAKVFLNAGPDQVNRQNPDLKYILQTARGPLMNALDAASIEYEAESQTRIGKLQSYQKMALFVIFATLIGEAVLIFRPLVARVHRYAERLKRMAMTDGLTGVDNNRSFTQKAMKELKSSRRHGKPMCIAILDLDHFKEVNDKHGHLVGDDVLRAFSQYVQRTMRLEDEFARIGGEEFAILLPHTNLDGARVITERIRNIIEISPIRYEENGMKKELFITVSIGVAEANPEDADIEHTMDAADKALYKAKETGRNRVVCSEAYSSGGNVVELGQSRKS